MSPSNAPSNPSIINSDLEHLNLNVLIVNLSEREAKPENVVENATLLNLDLQLIVYDPLFQDIPVYEDAGETSLVRRAQLKIKPLQRMKVSFIIYSSM